MMLLAASVTGITMFHYLTPLNHPALHDIFQRLYYLPIILAALWYGLRGGLICSVIVGILYAPHIFFQWGMHHGVNVEKYLELVLFNTVGAITGLLAQREQERTRQVQKQSAELKLSYRKLQQQTEQTIMIEEQLRDAEKLSTLGTMAAVLAHEIRNPLGSIRGTAEILKDDFPPSHPKHEFLEIQIRETERLNHVVEAFLSMARPRQQHFRSCSLQEALATIVTLVSHQTTLHGITITCNFPDHPVMIMADSEQLHQVFLNIIINALQATADNGMLTITIEQTQDAALIHIRDNGCGISPEVQAKIFEPFFTTREQGTGLGLAVAKTIVERHGGTITITSDLAKGTTVTLRFPFTIARSS